MAEPADLEYAGGDVPPEGVPFFIVWPSVLVGTVFPGFAYLSGIGMRASHAQALIAVALLLVPPAAGLVGTLLVTDAASRRDEGGKLLVGLLATLWCATNGLLGFTFAYAVLGG